MMADGRNGLNRREAGIAERVSTGGNEILSRERHYRKG